MQTIDCRGLACPQPVITVKRALEASPAAELTILLDNGAPYENVSRFLRNRGVTATETPIEDGVQLQIASSTPAAATAPTPNNRVLLISSDQLGSGPAELGHLLMKNFIISLLDQSQLPDRMIFLNSGVHLTTEGSEVLPALQTLADMGVQILSCGLCLDFFHKKDLLRAGSVTNMFTTAESLLLADSAVKL